MEKLELGEFELKRIKELLDEIKELLRLEETESSAQKVKQKKV